MGDESETFRFYAARYEFSGSAISRRTILQSIEIFGDLGQAYGMFVRGNAGGNAALQLRASQGYVQKLSAHALRSAWTA